MTPARTDAARRATVLALALALAAAGGAALPGAAAAGSLSLAALAGTSLSDPALGDYRWDLRPRPAFGARALLEGRRVAAGLRVWRTHAAQRIEVSGGDAASAVRSTSVELVARVRLARPGGVELLAHGAAGRVHLAYHPDRVAVPAGGSEPTTVTLAPIDEWIGGAGIAARRGLGAAWTLGIEVERRLFALDTARRAGEGIQHERVSFRPWDARLELARHFGR